jgi:hypothetical protein
VASDRLDEMCGLKVSDTTIREVCQAEGAQMAAWQRTAPTVRDGFQKAEGDIEFSADGTMVNTTEGWQEVKLAMFAKRKRGEPATPEEWDDRTLPKPTARVAFAAIEGSDRFGARFGQWAARLGIRDTSQITTLADGAKWIWEEASQNLIGCEGILDIYHALEHVSDTAKVLFGEGTAAKTEWSDRMRAALLQDGWAGFERLYAITQDEKSTNPTGAKVLNDLRNYLGNHVSHLHYGGRLAEGRSIGSGQVEGACKSMIGRRLKQTGARWRNRRLNRMASLCCLVYSHAWEDYWAQQAA